MIEQAPAMLWLAPVLVLPGALLLALVRHPARYAERLALASGLTVSLWPCLLLWSTVVGRRWTPYGLRTAMLLGLSILLLDRLRSSHRPGAHSKCRAADQPRAGGGAVLSIVLLAACCARAVQARSLAVPAWVDGLHHSAVTQAILDAGALPAGLRPYIPVDQFAYHFGFHAQSAATAWTTGHSAADAVLWTGQALSAFSVLGAYLLATRAGCRPLAAAMAAAVPATLFTYPAYFVSWSRYTQLAGLVALPAAWTFLADATRPRSCARDVTLAAVAGGGLALVHYRVAVFYVVGALLLGASRVIGRRRALGPQAIRALAVVGLALVVIGPWLVGGLGRGLRALDAAGTPWLGTQAGLETEADWLLRQGRDEVWLLVAVLGLLVGLVLRRRMALGIVSYGLVMLVAARPAWFGLGALWVLPPFSILISLYLPVAMGIGMLADFAFDLATRRVRPSTARRGLAVATVVVVAAGAVTSRDIVNADTVIATPADVAAARWIVRNTPADARFVVGTTHWHVSTCRGVDGGYWLPLLARRQTNVPPALYPYGSPAVVAAITRHCRIALRGDDLSDPELLDLMHETGAEYVYIGPAGRDVDGSLSRSRVRRVPWLAEIYARDGVHVFRLSTP